MSDVDIEQAKSLHRVAVQSADFCIDRNARLTAQERELIDYTVPALIASLTATQEKLAAAEANRELATMASVEEALRHELEKATDLAIRTQRRLVEAQEALTTAQAQIDAARERDLRLTKFAHDWGADDRPCYEDIATEVLAAFNTQDKP